MKIRDDRPPVDPAAMLVVKDDLHDIGFKSDLIQAWCFGPWPRDLSPKNSINIR